jgi:hypothetical protein
MKAIKERYETDQDYRQLIDSMKQLILEKSFTRYELREAYMFAEELCKESVNNDSDSNNITDTSIRGVVNTILDFIDKAYYERCIK